jgi:probable DNA repair protein
MGSAAIEIDAWLRDGGIVVTASDRAARAIAATFHRARRAEGLTAWPAPNIQNWQTFVLGAWEDRTRDRPDPRLRLNPTQEQAIWAQIVGSQNHSAALLDGPRHRLAALAVEAHELLAAYAPRYLRHATRANWQQDAGAFGTWLAVFDETCKSGSLLSPARLPLELIPLLQSEQGNSDRAPRPPLLLAGFDRILPVQHAVLDAWGEWRQTTPGAPAASVHFYEALDAQAELAACRLWCSHQLAANPDARLLIVTQDASTRRGEIERAFLQIDPGPASSPMFEFSLGVPLSQVKLPKAAHLLLRWLTQPIAEHELDWLLSTGYAASAQESSALQAAMRALRRRSLEQPQWTLRAFLSAIRQLGRSPEPNPQIEPWAARVIESQRLLAERARHPQSPLTWAELAPELLQTLQFAGSFPLSSGEFQAFDRWHQAVETCGSLGFDSRRIDWPEFLATLARTLDATLFAPESRDAPIQIAGPAESAGLTAEAIWFLGASEEAWPANGSTHPLLPPEVQREAGMPHATPKLDWDLAQAITTRLLVSSPIIHISFPRQTEAAEGRISSLVVQLVGQPQPLPAELIAPNLPEPVTVSFEDLSQIPYPPGKVPGGAGVLTSQSQCPFKAFATARLGAQTWDPAEAGLTPSQRGKLLHSVLHSIWAGPPEGVRSQHELLGIDDKSFVINHVQRVVQQELSPAIRNRMPRRYLELEELRLARHVAEWLQFEAARIAFEVAETEAGRSVSIAGLSFDLRLDRIDRLNDSTLLVIDYKTGDVSQKSWEMPRPDDIQLPLYAGFALDRENETLGGLVFAKVRPGDKSFAGHVGAPTGTLIASLKNSSSLARNPLTAEQLIDWRDYIEKMARDFLAGRADVDPREYPDTCDRCGLQTLCRIQESRAAFEAEDELENAEAADE